MNIESGQVKKFTEEEVKYLDKSKWVPLSEIPSKYIPLKNRSKYEPHVGKKEKTKKGLI